MVSTNSALAAPACRTSPPATSSGDSTGLARSPTVSPPSSRITFLPPPPAGERLALTCHGDCPALCQEPRGGCWDWDFPLPCAPTGAKSFEPPKSPEPRSWAQVAAGLRGHRVSGLGACFPGR